VKALVTGGGGFIGSHLVSALNKRGDQVRILCRRDYPHLARSGVEVHRGDVADARTVAAACRDVDIVFHVAAKAGVWGSRESFYRPNVTGTQNIIAACRACRVPKLVFTGSPSAVFDNYPDAYESHYAQTKALAEQRVRRANGPGLLTVSLRPHLVFGPGDPHLLPRLLARARQGRLVQVGDGLNRVDLSFIDDVVSAHLLAAEALAPGSPVAGAGYFITQGEPVLLWPWIGSLLARVGLKGPKRRVSLSTARRLGGVLESTYRLLKIRSEPPITRFVAAELALDHYYSIAKARRDFGFAPQLSMAEATTRTVAWIQSAGL